jgi:hypothetical protein
MAPIYNPAASATATQADEQYFTDLGLLTGMSKLIDATVADTFPTPDGTHGTAAVITNNLLKWGAASAHSWVGYNLGASYDKVLMLTYIIPSTAGIIYNCQISEDALDVTNPAASDEEYISNQAPAGTYMYKRTGAVWTALGTDTTIHQIALDSSAGYGTALYVENGTQKMFMKFGSTSEWFPIFSTSDGDLASFQAVAISSGGLNARCPTPFLVWGG